MPSRDGARGIYLRDAVEVAEPSTIGVQVCLILHDLTRSGWARPDRTHRCRTACNCRCADCLSTRTPARWPRWTPFWHSSSLWRSALMCHGSRRRHRLYSHRPRTAALLASRSAWIRRGCRLARTLPASQPLILLTARTTQTRTRTIDPHSLAQPTASPAHSNPRSLPPQHWPCLGVGTCYQAPAYATSTFLP